MRENKLEAVVPTLGGSGKKTADADEAASAPVASADKAAKVAPTKPEKVAEVDKSAAEKPVEH